VDKLKEALIKHLETLFDEKGGQVGSFEGVKIDESFSKKALIAIIFRMGRYQRLLNEPWDELNRIETGKGRRK
jgi:hypothetical protein